MNFIKQKFFLIFTCIFLVLLFSSFIEPGEDSGFSLKVEANGIRKSTGSVLFALYNREDAIPDEHYKKCFRKLSGEIVNGKSTVIFKNLPEGKYAVSILHDEDNDGKIDKNFILPIEGIGFSNYQTIGLLNKPNFEKASFILNSDITIMIEVIYL